MLSGHSNKKLNVTVKWDGGAPAIVCGSSPDNGKFFVGTKSVFNKTPKVNYTIQDIRNNHDNCCCKYFKRMFTISFWFRYERNITR